jgi:NAD(P)-dependent dehydrogenase (short-subunit alcohol dehydrogenase family)
VNGPTGRPVCGAATHPAKKDGVRMDRLRDKVVVVTGASSGLGREAAFELARRGCRLVLAARREDELLEVALMCRRLGGEALPVAADVSSEADVTALIDAALAAWGRIDVLVNNAGITLFAQLDEAPFDEHRRVIETNLVGAMLVARAVLPVFRRQESGILVNVGSVLSKIGQPYVPSYVISKFGLRGLSEALRSEVADQPDIHIVTLLPYTIDTPHFESGASEVGREARAMPPMQSPEKVARALVHLIEHPRRERHVPRAAALGLAIHWLMPRTTERLIARALTRFHFGALEPRTEGSIYRSLPAEGTVHGSRPPTVSGARFAAWIPRELLRIAAQSTRRRALRWRAARTTP